MGSSINAGDLRHQITWQQDNSSGPSATSAGADVADWVSIGTHFAKVETLTGSELWNAQQLKATASIKITARDFGNVQPSDRLLYEGTGRTFEINGVIRTEEIFMGDLALICSELKNPQ